MEGNDGERCEDCPQVVAVMAENAGLLRAWKVCVRQVRCAGMDGMVVGLDFTAVMMAAERMGVELDEWDMAGLAEIEAVVVEESGKG